MSGNDSKSCKDITKSDPATETIFSGMERERHCDLRHSRNPRRGPCQSPIYGSKRQDGRPSHHRLVRDEQVCAHPKNQDGAPRGYNKTASGALMGSQGRHQGCLLVSPDRSGVQKILLLLGGRDHVDVQTNAFRSNNGSLGLHPSNAGNKEVPKEARSSNKLLHRRFHSLGIHEVPGIGSSRVDQTSPHLVRLQAKLQEDLRVTRSVSDIPGRPVRPQVLNPTSSRREDPEALGPLQLCLAQAKHHQSRSGRSNRTGYLFLFGHPPRAYVREPADRVDERAHLCECSSCQDIGYYLSAKAIEAFLQRQLSITESVVQNSSARLGPYDGCLRLWLEWSHSSICYKGHLVGRGSIQIHQREGNVGSDFFRLLHEIHPGWKTCGHPHGQRGRIFLSQKNGFSALTSSNVPCQAISIFMCEQCHYFRGPTYSWYTKCPCGRRIKRKSQCHRQLPGPRNFVILFQSGRLTFKCGGRLMCYSGQYEVQPICLSMYRQQPKVCGVGCQGSGLVTFPASLSFPPGSNSRTTSSQDNEVLGNRAVNSPLPEWPCFGSPSFQSKVNAATSRFLFSLSDDRRKDGRKKEVLRLLDVGILDIPIPSPPEHTIPVSMLRPNRPSTSSSFSVSTFPVQRSHAAETVSPKSRTMTTVMRRHYRKLGYNRESRAVLKKQYSIRTINQYSGAWLRFSAYLKKKKIPRVEVKESTVLNYLSSRLRDPAKPEKGKVAPLTLRKELYSLLKPLWAKYDLKLDTTSMYSPTKHYLSSLLNLAGSKVDIFPEWNLKDLLDLLESSAFEPMEEKALETCRNKALILMMLATGRRLEDIQALESWKKCKSTEGSLGLKFKPYEGWKGKAVSTSSSWCPEDVTLYAIDEVAGKDLTALCPLRAFRIFANMRLAQGSSQRLWLHGNRPDGFLSCAVINVIKESMKVANPLPPAGGYPSAGTHHLRKFSLSFAYKYGFCKDLQQLWDRVGSKSQVTPLRVYIRNVPDITFYMCSPLGTLRPDMLPIRVASDPVRS